MRRLSILFVVLLILPFVIAQEPIDLEQNPISIYLIIPAIFIFLLLLVLVVATFRQDITLAIVRLMSFKRLFSRIGAGKRHEPVKSAAAGISRDAVLVYMSKINNIEKGISSAAPDEAFKDFTGVTKDFFADLIGANHSYTDEEIAVHLEKKRKALVAFSEKLSKMKYGGYQPTREEILLLINEFKALMSSQAIKDKMSSVTAKSSQNLIARIVEEDKKIFENIRQYVDLLKTEDKKQQINEMLSTEEKTLRRNISEAKKVYDDILKLYVQLSPAEKKLLYPKLLHFYDNVNKMIFSSLYGKKTKEELAYFSKELAKLKEMPEQRSILRKLTEIPAKLPKIRPPEPPQATRRVPMVGAGKDNSGVFEIRLRIPTFGLHKPHHDASTHKASDVKAKLPELKIPKAKPVKVELPESLELPKLPKAKKVEKPVSLAVEAEFPEASESIIKVYLDKGKKISPVLEKDLPRPPLPPITEKKDFVSKPAKSLFVRKENKQEELHDLEAIRSVVQEHPRQILQGPKKTNEERFIIDRISKMIESMPLAVKETSMALIRSDLKKAERQLSEGMLSDAEVTYEGIKPKFMSLSEGDKNYIYPEIVEFYKRLRVAIDTRQVRAEVKVKPNASLSEEEKKLLEMLENLKSSIS